MIANSSFASEQSLITFLSVFRGATTFATFLILLFSGRVYSAMGLPNAPSFSRLTLPSSLRA